MGMDVFIEWKGMTPKEYKAQISTGFESRGRVGYLRGGGFGWFKDVLYRLFDFIEDFDEQYYPLGNREIKLMEENLQDIIDDRSRPALRPGLMSMSGYEERQTMDVPDSEIEQYIDFIDFAKRKLKEGKKLTLHISR